MFGYHAYFGMDISDRANILGFVIFGKNKNFLIKIVISDSHLDLLLTFIVMNVVTYSSLLFLIFS